MGKFLDLEDLFKGRHFDREAIKGQGSGPRTVTLDGYAASHRAVREMKADGELAADLKLRSSKYPNNTLSRTSGATFSAICLPSRANWSC
ncbi:MAG TPA: hypothetical protein PLX84_00705 [Acidiphilium sp.]|nr:hypothetical protein [Acidiphilium sp.]